MKHAISFMKTYKNNLYTNHSWLIIKLIWVWYFVLNLINKLNLVSNIELQLGACKIIPCNILLCPQVKIIIFALSVLLGFFYLFEYKMKTVIFLLSVISVLVFSIVDSTGVFYRNEGFSLIFIGQFIAYYLSGKKNSVYEINKLRIKLSMFIITMLYFLSFLSKITTSGVKWFTQVNGFANHILKSKMYEYATTGEIQTLLLGQDYYNFIIGHPILIGLMLFIALILEGFAFLSNFNYKIAFFSGIGLMGMHLGIYFLMDIVIISIVLPMILFVFNLPAVIITIIDMVNGRFISVNTEEKIN